MKLNPDCVRDILLTVEMKTGYEASFNYPSQNCELLSKYTNDEIMYHFHQCGKSDLIEIESAFLDGSIVVTDLTPKGHEFLANIRDDKFFSRVKNICKEIGIASLKDITQVASNSAALLIKSYFGLN